MVCLINLDSMCVSLTSPVVFTQVGIAAYTCVDSFVVLLTAPRGLGGYVLCKKLKKREVGVSHTHHSRSGLSPRGSAMSLCD